jgi:glycosyltransferase involved in cell wall biosynthesis
VVVTGEVPDVRPHYQDSWFQIVPLRIGGGTRLKIVESLCIGCPVLSTTIGAQGLDLRDGEHLLLADTPAEFAAAARRLAGDAALRERLRVAGRRQVLAHYSSASTNPSSAAHESPVLPPHRRHPRRAVS